MRLSLIFLLFCGKIIAQPKTYKNLVLEGGGIRGIAYCGAIEKLEKRGVLDNLLRVGGTSAGAIQASLLAVGYNASELSEIVQGMKIQAFNDGQYIFIGGANRLWKRYGWYKGVKFERWLEHLIEQKTGVSGLTFGQLHEMTKTNRHLKDLYVTATNLSKQSGMVFSYENYPKMSVAKAVRISMSIPMYYGAVFIDESGNVYDKPQKNTKTDVLVDGGILMNYPINLFDKKRYMNVDNQEDSLFFNHETLGLRLERSEQIKFDNTNFGIAPYEINGLMDYISAFYNLVLSGANRKEFGQRDLARTISIDFKNISPRVRKLPPADRDTLIEAGRAAVEGFFLGDKKK